MEMYRKILLLLLSWLFFIQNSNTIVFCSTTESFLVETLPEELIYNQTISSKPTYEALLELINSANKSIEIASMYWTMLGLDVMPDPVPESKKGEDIVQALIQANKNRSVKIKIAVNADPKLNENKDLQLLKEHSEIRQVNFTKFIGSGILHTKFLVIDSKDFYLGSANMDWRALTHVKELGIYMKNNPDLANDLKKIFDIYWFMGDESITHLPNPWPTIYDAEFNATNPLKTEINSDGNDQYNIYFSSSPRQLCSSGRTNDLDAILNLINNADQFIYIAVMDYFPLFLYEKQQKYWPIIDDALRKAVIERRVQIRLMASRWSHTRSSLVLFLKSLQSLKNVNILRGSIETRLFTFPSLTEKIPFTEVNHNKYLVTDKAVYIGTSNWSADYFVNTGGVGIIMEKINENQSKFYNETKNVFLRDWNSSYAKNVF